MSHADIIASISSGPISSDILYDAIAFAEEQLLDQGRESFEALDIAIRLLDASNRGKINARNIEAISFLVRDCGLFPYVNQKNLPTLQKALFAAHTVKLSDEVVLHSKQMEVLLKLIQGENVILSAPTSFGKSLIVDAFIQSTRPETVVMIVPTIALIDETRRRITKNFQEAYQVISHRGQQRLSKVRAIYVLTQERLLERLDIGKIDLLFVDEFYKLDPSKTDDPSKGDDRAEALNVALYKSIPKAKQVFMAGPHVSSIVVGPKWTGKFLFFQTDYRTVSVNIVDRSGSAEHLETFLNDLKGVGNEASLVFTAHPPSAIKVTAEILNAELDYTSPESTELGAWIEKNYHKDWKVAKAAARGIATHHGRIPRSLAQFFVRQFDSGSLKVLICTSTLIEGVNTAAANVFIYDKQINRSDFDFFSFANIRGRVGRMMRHFVGNAFLYHQPPSEVATEVNVPVLADPSTSSDYILLNVDHQDLRGRALDRADELVETFRLPRALLARFGSLGMERIMIARDKIDATAKKNPELLVWSGFPDKMQRIFLCEIILTCFANPRRQQLGGRTAPQLAWCLSMLSRSKSLSSFLKWFAQNIGHEPENDGIDRAFQFLNGCEYLIPTVMALTEGIAKHCLPNEPINYLAYVAATENLFRPAWMRALDEMGIPFPLAERLQKIIPEQSSIDRAMALLRSAFINNKIPRLDSMDIAIIRSALALR